VHKITVIISTAGRKQRANSLIRAIDCILDQKDVDAVPLIVLNGKMYDKDLFTSLKTNKEIRFTYVEIGSLPNAIYEGRKLVDTEFFSFLDDDDIYTIDSLSKKISEFDTDESLDVVVGNGYKVESHGRYKMLKNNHLLNNQPLTELTKYTWLPSCSPLFKTNSVELNFFDRKFKYYEWTYLAYRLCLSKKIRFIDDITYIVNSTDASLSKSEEYILAEPLLYLKLIQLNLPTEIRRKIREKEINCYHNISNYYLDAEMKRKAWKWHFKSLMSFYGFRYWTYTRKLI
jgi:hypothetical protein